MRRRLAPVVWLCGLVAAGSRAFAQNGPDNDPDAAPGYVKSVFDHGQLDSINLYNGQVTASIAIGLSYLVGPKLRFEPSLV